MVESAGRQLAAQEAIGSLGPRLRPVHTYPVIFESATFSFRIRLPSTRIRRIRQRIRKKINPLSRVEKKSATITITCGRVNTGIFESDDVKSVSNLSPNNKPIWRHNLKARVGRTQQISRHYVALQRMLYSASTCRRGNFCIRKERVADSNISGYVWTGPRTS